MPVRSLNSSPAELAHLEASFHRAWRDINLLRNLDIDRQAEQREWLAQIILALATTQPSADVADAAVRQFLASVPSAISRGG